MCVVGVVAIVNAVQVMGEFAAVSSAALDTPATDSQISGGLIANGLVGMLSGFLGGVPTATFGQNVGIIAENKVVNRMVFTLAAAILLIAGLLPSARRCSRPFRSRLSAAPPLACSRPSA